MNLPTAVSGNTFNADNGMTGFNGATLSGACPEQSRRNANGNLTSDGTNTYTWDARNHLSGMSGASTSASFVYGAFGRRVSKTINGATTQFLYDGLNPVQELDGANPPSVTANLLTGLGVDEYFARTDSSGTMAFLRDALGSTIGLVNSAGSIGTSYTYEPFGNTTISGSSANAFQFTGRENDGTGLYYFRARYYDPRLQRFISQDPIGIDGGSTDFYSYVGDQPTDLLDPSGRQAAVVAAGGLVVACPECVAAAAVGAAVGLVAADYLFHARNRVKPDVAAQGPHCGFRRGPGGQIGNYTEFDSDGRPVKRFRGQGGTHGGLEPPIVYEPSKPNGPLDTVRPAEPSEIPGAPSPGGDGEQ